MANSCLPLCKRSRIADYFIMVGLKDTKNPIQELEENETLGNTIIPRAVDPIIDLVVIARSNGEDIPPGYTCVEHTLTGYNADLNHGSLRGSSLFLCFRRGTRKPPITDISVYYDGKDKLLPNGYHIIRNTAYGRCADLNSKCKPPTFLAYRRAATTGEHDQFAISSIGIVLKNKGENPPHTFHLINRCLNKRRIGSEVYLCFKKAIVQAHSIAYKADLQSRYPIEDHDSFPLPGNIELFCLPMGALVEYWSKTAVHPLPSFSTFALTQESGDKVYGAAVTFYEQLPEEMWTPYLERVFEENDARRAFTSKCICILSHWPFFDTFRWFLRNLYRISISGRSEIPIERYITHFMSAVPFPPPDRPQVLLQMGHEKHYLHRPVDSPLPLSGASFINLLRCLGPENCFTLLCLVLTEQKILLHSRRPALLTSVAEALCSIIFPFEWQCPYIPLCPVKLADVLNAPCPFIVGIDSKYFDLYHPPVELTCVDLDTNTISDIGDKKQVNWRVLPKKYSDVILKQLRKRHHQLLKLLRNQGSDAGLSYAVDMAPLEYDDTIKRKLRSISLQIQHLFLAFQAALLKGYKQFLLPITKSPSSDVYDAKSLFAFDAFLKSRPSGARKFFSHLIKTQACHLFTRFVEQRSFVSAVDVQFAFFDSYMEKVENGVCLEELEDSKKWNYITLVVPSPDTEGLPENKLYEYTSFPTLDASLLSLPIKSSSCQADLLSASSHLDSNLTRSKAERKELEELARKHSKSPLLWAKYLVRNCYTIWFMYLPAYINTQSPSSRALEQGFQILLQMQHAKLHTEDEYCYRCMMYLCGVYKQPILAVRVLLTMRAVNIQPNAITYGYYNKAVSENPWTDRTGAKLWALLRNVIKAVSVFRLYWKTKSEELTSLKKFTNSRDINDFESLNFNNDSAKCKRQKYKRLSGSLDVLTQSHNPEHFARPFMSSTPPPSPNNTINFEQRIPNGNAYSVKASPYRLRNGQVNTSSNTSMSSNASSRKRATVFSIQSRRSRDTLSAANSLSSLNSSLSSLSRRMSSKRHKNGFSKSFDSKLELGLLSSFDSRQELSSIHKTTVIQDSLYGKSCDGGDDEDVAIEAAISSCVKCHSCNAILYDEEIMAGWTANESNLNTSCRYCCAKFVAFLTISIKDYRFAYQDRHPLTLSSINCKLSRFLSSLDHDAKIERYNALSYSMDDSICGKSYDSSSLTPVANTVTVDLSKGLSSSVSDSSSKPHCAGLTMSKSCPEHILSGLKDVKEQISSMENNSRSVEILSDMPLSSNDFSTEKTVDGITCAEEVSVNSTSTPVGCDDQNAKEDVVSVPYLSPIVLQKELESLISNHGPDILNDSTVIDNHSTVYWNLVWYFFRMGLPSSLPGLLLKRAKERDIETYGEPLKLRTDIKRVIISPLWDFEKVDENDGIPLYRQFLSDNNCNGLQDGYGGSFSEDQSCCSHTDLVQSLVTHIQKNNLFTPITSLLEERVKDPYKTRHRSIYRELLYLACVSSQYVDQDNFDKEFRSGLRCLSPTHMDQLRDYDRCPGSAITFCKKAFLPLNLPV